MVKYVLITPARNEEEFLEQTIQSVVAQTILPQRWVIVNDRSDDRTGEIAQKYADQHDFIQLINISGDSERNFGSKAKAVEFAYQQLSGVDFNYVGNLDADITFQPDYYETILNKLEANPKLGLAGGIRYDKLIDGFRLIDISRNSVGGPIQLFRKECFEEIGGYTVLPYGGIDAVAEISARMKGWEVRSFPEYRVYHHRATGTAARSVYKARFRAGIRDYSIGYHLSFALARSIPRTRKRPYVIGAMLGLCGYLYASIKRIDRPVSDELIAYLHAEQKGRLRGVLSRFGLQKNHDIPPINKKDDIT